MTMERIKAPKELQRIVKRKQNKASDIVGELKKLGHGEALRLSVKEDFSSRSPRAIYQSLWRAGRRQGVRIAFLHDEKKDRIILARVDAK